MTKRVLLLSCLLIPLLMAAGAAPNAELARWLASITSENLKADLFFLSSDEMQGRYSLSPEGKIASQWIASQFMKYGLEPAGDGGTYFQQFPIVTELVDLDRSGLRIEIASAGGMMVRDYTAGGPLPGQALSEASGPVVFAGFGISAPQYGYDDYAGLDVRGKVVLVLVHDPGEDRADSPFKGTWNTRYAYSWYKRRDEARSHGAIAIVTIAESRRHVPSEPRDPDQAEFASGTPTQSLDIPGDIPTTTISEAGANELLSANGKSAAELRREIDASLKPHSFTLEGVRATVRKVSSDRRVVTARNVVGLLEGIDPKLKVEVVVVTAHYDHLGARSGRIFNGADDNGSGVVALLNIARAYRANEIRTKRSILFIAFEAEEQGLLGSFAYVQHPVFPLDKTVANINSDMIGRDEDTYRAKPEEHRNSVNIIGTLYSPDLRAVNERANQAVGLTLDYKTDKDDSESWFFRSDQYAFADASIPVIFYTTGFHRDYHTSRDTWDRINYPKLAAVTRLMFLTSLEVANAATRPKFVE